MQSPADELWVADDDDDDDVGDANGLCHGVKVAFSDTCYETLTSFRVVLCVWYFRGSRQRGSAYDNVVETDVLRVMYAVCVS